MRSAASGQNGAALSGRRWVASAAFSLACLLPLQAAAVGIFGPRTPEAFGHLGFTNIWGWADPERRIAVALLTSGKPLLSLHALWLLQLLWEVNSAFPRGPATSQ